MALGINLFVVPLDKRVDNQILRNAFSEYGELFDAQVARDENGESKGYGFVHFCSVNDGLRAKDEMENKQLFGRALHVKIGNKQEGNCYKDGVKNSMWANDWNRRNDAESACDTQSQYSDALTSDSAGVETRDVRDRMKKLFESQSFTDVTFYQKNNRRASISAHRAILAISSPLFKNMLFEQDKINVGEKLEVQISNIPFDAFTCIVKFLYTDEISFENEALVQGVLDGAKQFGIHSLVNQCKEYLENVELTCENVCSKLHISTSNKIASLKDRCIEFIQKNTLPVIQSPDFQTCSSATIKTICKLQSFNLQSEMQLLEAVMQWLRSHPYHERRGLMESLIKCIRFLNFTVAEMGDVLKKYSDLMTPDEGLNIMIFLADPPKNPNFTSLPSWCNRNMSNRCFFKDDTRGSMMGLNRDPNGALVGKIFFPLKSDPEQGFVSKLISLLQMKCISGHHVLKAITLSFERPLSDKCRINDLLIKVHVNPAKFNTSENVQIVNSETVRVEFKRLIKVRCGDTLDIEAEAKNIELYKFLQYDEAYPMPANPHFNICISSLPRIGKLYFISGIEYGPQERLPNKAIRGRNSRK